LNYDQKENFIEKIFQISETMEIRIGIMLVGKACSGKTSIYTIIQSSYLCLYESFPSLYRPLEFTLINPKAVNTNGLYGYVNLLTNEWHDGIVSKIIRQTAQEERDSR
jgi:dynein heavy chain